MTARVLRMAAGRARSARGLASRRPRGAFSLVEMVVAVGAFAIVAVSLAAIFNSVGDTISAGRRQSRLNQLASQIERVMRADFERMTRDGFLVIINELAIGDPGAAGDTNMDGLGDRLDVRLFPGDPSPRPRRVDQIMFFTRGEFETSRPPVQAGLVARSNEARIWYGHGQLKFPDGDTDFDTGGEETYTRPRLDDTMQGYGLNAADPAVDRLGHVPQDIADFNPNEFASDWSLLRHVTLLCPPEEPTAQSLPDFGETGLYGVPVNRAVTGRGAGSRLFAVDSEYQIALQPALSSVFWNIQRLDPTITTPTLPGYVRGFDTNVNPNVPAPRATALAYHADPDGPYTEVAQSRSTSGLVDIATTSLAEIRSVVMRAQFEVNTTIALGSPGLLDFEDFEQAMATPKAGGLLFPNTTARGAHSWEWMVNALPIPPEEGPYSDDNSSSGVDPLDRTSARIRYLSAPTNLSAGTSPSDPPEERLRGAYEQGDQEVLTRWAFLPRCTEFIVEWSYGWVYDDKDTASPYFVPADSPLYKQLVWFGRERRTLDTNGDGRITVQDLPTVRWYEPRVQELATPNREDPSRWMLTRGNENPQTPRYPRPAVAERVAFGYTYMALPQGVAPGSAATPQALEWPWPKLIRVTMSIADPGDPSIETTVEVVFEVPDDRA